MHAYRRPLGWWHYGRNLSLALRCSLARGANLDLTLVAEERNRAQSGIYDFAANAFSVP